MSASKWSPLVDRRFFTSWVSGSDWPPPTMGTPDCRPLSGCKLGHKVGAGCVPTYNKVDIDQSCLHDQILTTICQNLVKVLMMPWRGYPSLWRPKIATYGRALFYTLPMPEQIDIPHVFLSALIIPVPIQILMCSANFKVVWNDVIGKAWLTK